MVTLEEIFKKEFRTVTRAIPKTPIENLPLPEIKEKETFPSARKYQIQNLTCPVYEKLNGLSGFYSRNIPASRKKRNLAGKIEIGRDGKPLIEQITVPQNKMLVFLKANLEIPYGFTSEAGVEYVDVIKIDGKQYLKLLIPKENLHEHNRIALIRSTELKRHRISAVQIFSWNFGKIKLQVIPHNPNLINPETIAVFDDLPSVTPVAQQVLDFWLRAGITPDARWFQVESENLVLQHLACPNLPPTPINAESVASLSNRSLEDADVDGL